MKPIKGSIAEKKESNFLVIQIFETAAKSLAAAPILLQEWAVDLSKEGGK